MPLDTPQVNPHKQRDLKIIPVLCDFAQCLCPLWSHSAGAEELSTAILQASFNPSTLSCGEFLEGILAHSNHPRAGAGTQLVAHNDRSFSVLLWAFASDLVFEQTTKKQKHFPLCWWTFSTCLFWFRGLLLGATSWTTSWRNRELCTRTTVRGTSTSSTSCWKEGRRICWGGWALKRTHSSITI